MAQQIKVNSATGNIQIQISRGAIGPSTTANVANTALNLNAASTANVIIGGGVAQSGDILLNEIRTQMALQSKIYPESAINIIPATLGFHAGAIGAALFGATKAGAELSLMS